MFLHYEATASGCVSIPTAGGFGAGCVSVSSPYVDTVHHKRHTFLNLLLFQVRISADTMIRDVARIKRLVCHSKTSRRDGFIYACAEVFMVKSSLEIGLNILTVH